MARLKTALALALSAFLAVPGLPARVLAQEEAAADSPAEAAANPICDCTSLELAAADDEAAASVACDGTADMTLAPNRPPLAAVMRRKAEFRAIGFTGTSALLPRTAEMLR